MQHAVADAPAVIADLKAQGDIAITHCSGHRGEQRHLGWQTTAQDRRHIDPRRLGYDRLASQLTRNQIGSVEGAIELIDPHIVCPLILATIDVVADKTRTASTGIKEPIGGVGDPLAVTGGENGQQQLTRLNLPQTQRLVVTAREQRAPIC